MCYVNDAEPNRIYRERIRRARKPRPCEYCSHTIPTGERYLSVSGLSDDGCWFGWHACRVCAFNALRLFRIERAEGCGPEESIYPPWYVADALSERGRKWIDPRLVPADFEVDHIFEVVDGPYVPLAYCFAWIDAPVFGPVLPPEIVEARSVAAREARLRSRSGD